MLNAFAQNSNVGINNTGAVPANSAMLDVVSTNKGVLIPRINLISDADVATITSPVTSLMVYNTNATMTNGTGTGFYYWNGSKWTPITVNSNSSAACRPSMETNELTAGGVPCVGTACGAIMDLRTCAINCGNLVYNGFSDWRMPTVDDIVNLISVAPNPASANLIWTATKSTGFFPAGYAAAINFSTMYDDQILSTSAVNTYCRCVR